MCCTDYFKGTIILIVVFITTIRISFAQSYFHSPNDTIISDVPFDDVSVFNITQIHPTADTIYFKWHKQSVVMPATWEAYICDYGNCYASLEDSGTMAPIVTGGDGLMSLHINPKFEAGIGIIRYSIYATNTAVQVDTLTWIITAPALNGIENIEDDKPVISYSHKQIICKNIRNNFSKAFLFDLNGKLLLEKDIEFEEITLLTQEYSPQILILQLIGKQNSVNKIFNY